MTDGRPTVAKKQTNVDKNSSGDEIANVNFWYDDSLHALI